MGNSCNKVTPVVCTARITCTVPIGCASAGRKGAQPAVIEPKLKEELQPSPKPPPQPAPQPAFQAAPPPTPAAAPAPPSPAPAPPPAEAQPETPSGAARPAPTLDPVEPFQATEVLSPSVRAESVGAVDDAPATSRSDSAKRTSMDEREQVEVTNVERLEHEEPPESKAQDDELVGVDEGADPDKATAKGAEADDTEKSKALDDEPGAADDAEPADVADDDGEGKAYAPSAKPTPPEQSSAEEENQDADAADSSELQVTAGVDAEVSEEDSWAEPEEPFQFAPDALAALEQFQLRDKAEVLGSRLAGHAAAQALSSMCIHALDAGAATHNCRLLLTQVRIIVHVLAHSQQQRVVSPRAVRSCLEQLQPALAASEQVVGGWSHRGSMEKFMSGRAADDEFLEVHLQLKDFAQTPAFQHLLASLPPSEAAELAELQSSQHLNGYGSVEASRAAFERLLLLFILRYKPTKTRSQKERLRDLLAEYADAHSPTAAACRAARLSADGEEGSEGGEGEPRVPDVEEQLEHLARVQLGRAATHAVPLMVVLMTNMWGASPGEVPRGRTEKWRMAVRMALEPLRVATGAGGLPEVPREGVRPWDESA